MKLKMGKLVLALCELALGVLLLIEPVSFTTAIITVLGVLLLLAGVVSILRYFKTEPKEAALEQNLTRGLLEAIAGLFCILNSEWFIVTFPMLTVLYGVVTLITGVSKLQWSVDLLRMKAEKWFWAAISSAVTLICSVVILCNPFTSTAMLWMFIAITLIVEAIFDVLVVIFAKEETRNQTERHAPNASELHNATDTDNQETPVSESTEV